MSHAGKACRRLSRLSRSTSNAIAFGREGIVSQFKVEEPAVAASCAMAIACFNSATMWQGFSVLLKSSRLGSDTECCLPASLPDTGDEPVAGQFAEADAADAELAIDCPRPAAQLAAALNANLFARRHLDLAGSPPAGLQLRHLLPAFDVLCFGSHDFGRPRSSFCAFPPKQSGSMIASVSSLGIALTKPAGSSKPFK